MLAVYINYMKASSYAEVVIDIMVRSQAFFFLTLFFVFVQFVLVSDGTLILVGAFMPNGVFVPHGFLVLKSLVACSLLKNKMSVKGRNALYINSP